MAPIEDLFIQKCRFCNTIFRIEVKDAYLEAKSQKRENLLELIELMDGEKKTDGAMAAARAILINSDEAMTALFRMISVNLFRTPKVSVAKFGGQLKEDNFNQRTGDETEETQILLEE